MQQKRRLIIGASSLNTKTLVIATNHANFFLSHRLELARRAQAQGYNVVGMFPLTPEVKQVEALGFTTKTFLLNRSGMNPWIELKSIFSFYRAMQQVKPDIYHGFTIKPLIYGIIIARLQKVPIIIGSVTGLGYSFLAPGLTGWVIRKIIGFLYLRTLRAQPVQVVFQNADDQALFLKSQWIESHQAQIILGTGVDTKKFHPPSQTRSNDKIIILFPGRLLIHKGLRELFQACKILAQKKLNFELQICGSLDPENRAALPADEFAEWQKEKFINYRGQISNMSDIYREAHIVCLPSYREGLALALLEAASSGCALVTTDAPGCRDVVEDQVTGLLVGVQEINNLEKALNKLIVDHDLRDRFGKVAQQKALTDYTQDKILNQFLSIYQGSTEADPQNIANTKAS